MPRLPEEGGTVMTDQELRAELIETITGKWRVKEIYTATISASVARELADSLLPVVRARLAQAWDDGFNTSSLRQGQPWRPSVNPWRQMPRLPEEGGSAATNDDTAGGTRNQPKGTIT